MRLGFELIDPSAPRRYDGCRAARRHVWSIIDIILTDCRPSDATMIKREEDGIWVVLEETIASHHDAVFDCLTTPDGLTRWFPVAARVDLRQGGQIVLGWDAQFTKRTTVAILDYDAGGKVVWDWHASSDDTHAPVYWTVKPSVEKGSIVTLRQGPFREDVDSLIAMADEAESWRWYLCNLRGVLEMKHDMRRVRPL